MWRPGLRLLLLLAAITPATATPPSGRLLLSPEERSALERQRLTPQASPLQQAPTLTLNGIIRPSRGQGTRWINGVPDHTRQPLPQPLPVGDTWNTTQTRHQPLLGEGILRVHRTAAE